MIPRTCAAGDDFSHQLGDPEETSTKVALDFLAGRSCAPIPVGTGVGAQGVAQRFHLLRPAAPNAAQHDNPALF